MPVVTISSQHGAGARDVGRLVADSLVLQYVDQSVLVDAARQLGVTVSKIARKDERTDSFRERLGHFLQRALERSAAGGQVDPMLGAANLEVMLAQTYQEMADGEIPGIVDDRSFLEASSQIIRELGEEVRATRVQQWEDLGHDEAIERMRSFNRSRAAFHKKFWKVDVWDPRLYDLVLNTNRLSYETVARLILEAAESEPRSD